MPSTSRTLVKKPNGRESSSSESYAADGLAARNSFILARTVHVGDIFTKRHLAIFSSEQQAWEFAYGDVLQWAYEQKLGRPENNETKGETGKLDPLYSARLRMDKHASAEHAVQAIERAIYESLGCKAHEESRPVSYSVEQLPIDPVPISARELVHIIKTCGGASHDLIQPSPAKKLKVSIDVVRAE